MAIDKQQLEHLAQLARLKLEAEDESVLQKQVTDILDFVSQLDRVDTAGTEPTYYISQADVSLRPDRAAASADQPAVKKSFPEIQDDLLKTPKIFK